MSILMINLWLCRAEQRRSSHIVKAVMDVWCYVMVVQILLERRDVQCIPACGYSDEGGTGRSGLVSIMTMQCVINCAEVYTTKNFFIHIYVVTLT